jgi:UDP-N-acetylmuramate: L-alanyl-gamma-D-glutamyl-meso-diaminopimelate ligase
MAPSYMFGGLSANISTSARLKETDTAWSVLEGDEYKIARWDNRPKFALYRPTHLLLTSISWDHADLYPTEDLYINVFNELVKNIPQTGIIVACSDSEAVSQAASQAQAHVITYGKNSKADYIYNNVNQTRAGLQFTISHDSKAYMVSAPILGAHMAENICGAFALAVEIGIDPDQVIASISRFAGVKRRLEKRYEGFVTIFDDLAHSPTKAAATLKTLRAIYPNQHIFAIFEPNTGNRTQQSIPGYAQAFTDADTVLIPTLTKLKVDEKNENPPFDGTALSQVISKDHSQVLYIEKDTDLINRIMQDAKKEDVIVFLGSHGFRGMIDELVRRYQEQ